uniref:NADH-ubiquinone oxidoreductase chain 4L n=1 Tax=Coleoptera sp. 30 KM-2017 TaxID=2219335 RepID=A0A346RKD1_9COLE|nr:NADH dehydrogenase subunit 4L [Coleoptera sp. 30 KM-2017]
MLIFYFYLCIFMYMVGLFVFSFKSMYLLMMLLSIEFIFLSLFFFLFLNFNLMGIDYYFGMLFIVMGVCEGSMGLAVLVSLIHSFGNDYFNSFNILW